MQECVKEPDSSLGFSIGTAGYRLDGPVLLISGELNQILDMNFDLSVADLLDVEGDDLLLDMAMVTKISSGHLDRIATLAASAADRGKTLSVRAPSSLKKIFEQTGLNKVLEIYEC